MPILPGEGDRRLLVTRSMQSGAAVTPSDSVNFAVSPCSALWVGGEYDGNAHARALLMRGIAKR